MKKLVAALVMTGILFIWSTPQAAEISGVVTKPDGITPIPNIGANLLKFNAETLNYENLEYQPTDVDGTFHFVLTAPSLGNYLVLITNPESYYYEWQAPNPWGCQDFFSQSSRSSIYYSEMYDNVTALTPNKAPKVIAITSETQIANLDLIALNEKTHGLMIDGPITINGVSYGFFSLYPSPVLDSAYSAPELPTTGGTLNISFDLKNLNATRTVTFIKTVAYLRSIAPAWLQGNINTTLLASPKKIVIPAHATATVELSVIVPANFMSDALQSAACGSSSQRFNIGIQSTNSGVSNGFQMAIFPVMAPNPTPTPTPTPPPPGDLAMEEKSDLPLQPPKSPRRIPLKFSAEGKPLEWGPAPYQER